MANNQNTKYVDLTRTWLPIDPNSFPDSLHVKEGPDDRVPVMAYKGYNFLPTSYGYRSYFGTNQTFGIDDIAERVDLLFNYQNNSFENILIALCDSGIWYKSAATSGAWVQALSMPDYRGTSTHFEWSWTIINDNLYVYRQNFASYQKIVSSASAPGFTLTSVVPNFLNMAAQQGIFRAGARLGFWDSADATAWSNLDDFTDFTPSLETLANISTFSQVIGRIVTIISHGDGYIIYGTKSAVYVQENPEALFQWKPTRILDVAGIAYRNEAIAAVPDTTHYVYSSVGLYKIEAATPSIIVPEVTDFLKESKGPKYIKLLEGRYLAIQSLDADYVEGIAQFTDEAIPAVTIKFPGANLNLLDEVADAETQGGQAFCPILNGLSNGAYSQPTDSGDYDPSKLYRPVYTAYLSRGGAKADDIVWSSVPCGVVSATGVPVGFSPGTAGSTAILSTNETNKTAVAGSDAYLVGGWTIERFVGAQSALWQIEQNNVQEYIDAIIARAHSSTSTYRSAVAVNTNTPIDCDLGNYVLRWSSPQFGFSPCEFWLTRYALAAVNIRTQGSTIETSQFFPDTVVAPTILGWAGTPGITPTFPTPLQAGIAVWDNVFGAGSFVASGKVLVADPIVPPNIVSLSFNIQNPGGPASIYSIYADTANAVAPLTNQGGSGGNPAYYIDPAHYTVTKSVNADNRPVAVSIAPIPDTAFCKLTGWDDGTTIIAPGATCTAPSTYPEGSNNNAAPLGNGKIIADDGTFCSQPFEPFIIPGTPAVTINWPDQVVTIPSGTYFLQVGSAAPLYPTFEGALMYDLHLKKWGKYRGRHLQLLDYSPINSYGPSEQSYARFGIMGGILAEGGSVRTFDAFPDDSYITYGKLGYYRQGNTSVEEMHIHMRTPSDCTVTVETSLSGKNLTTGLTRTESYTNATKCSYYGGYTGRWHNVKIAGFFDITYLEYRGIVSGKR